MVLLEELIGQDYTVIGSGRYVKTAEHDSLVIDCEKQVFYWNSKDISGNAFRWLTRIKGMSEYDAKKMLGSEEESLLPPPRKEQETVNVDPTLVDAFYNMGKNFRDYWYNERGYIDSTIDLFKLGYTGEWYTIPFFVNGEFRNFQLRKPATETSPKKAKGWYKGVGPLPFNIDMMFSYDWGVLTEGPVDAIMLVQHGIPAFSSNAGTNFEERWFPYIMHMNKIYIVYDNDKAGIKGSAKVAKILGDRALVYNFEDFDDGFDITDFFKSGRSRYDFLHLIESESRHWYER